ncbi:MAG: chorismate synthase [Acholeplasmatales bacterium]|jgi:chorismate synthase|nr:chorismate synthase [Acholeplasmatales bacterium]
MNQFGKLFQITLYGESHNPTMGLVIDGLPSGITIDNEEIARLLSLRKAHNSYETSRHEEDEFSIEAGIFKQMTTGAPINIVLKNSAYKSTEYDFTKEFYRSSQVDFVSQKYPNFDWRGGGFLSGRVTALLVIAGYFASLITKVKVSSKIISPSEQEVKKITALGDSLGGQVEIRASVSPFLGEPIFYKATSVLSSLLYSIPTVKGVIFGELEDIFLAGSKYVDPIINASGKTLTNHSGGINAGITNGNELIINCFIRPISSFSLPQPLFNKNTNKQETVALKGRHDLFHLQRLQVVLESAVQIGLADLTLLAKVFKSDL